MPRPTIATIGFGAMAGALFKALEADGDAPRIGSCLLHKDSTRALPATVMRHDQVAALVAARPALAVECANHAAVREAVPTLLAAGIDVVIASIGALADEAVRARIERAAAEGGARAIPVAGGIGGLDVLQAARCADVERVTYTGRKPPAAWRGTAADDLVDLSRIDAPTVFFTGNAGQAARSFPKNANVAAAVALCGIGFTRTEARLVADPNDLRNRHELEIAGAFGTMRIELANAPLPDNPRTSWLAALSVEAAVRRHFRLLQV